MPTSKAHRPRARAATGRSRGSQPRKTCLDRARGGARCSALGSRTTLPCSRANPLSYEIGKGAGPGGIGIGAGPGGIGIGAGPGGIGIGAGPGDPDGGCLRKSVNLFKTLNPRNITHNETKHTIIILFSVSAGLSVARVRLYNANVVRISTPKTTTPRKASAISSYTLDVSSPTVIVLIQRETMVRMNTKKTPNFILLSLVDWSCDLGSV